MILRGAAAWFGCMFVGRRVKMGSFQPLSSFCLNMLRSLLFVGKVAVAIWVFCRGTARHPGRNGFLAKNLFWSPQIRWLPVTSTKKECPEKGTLKNSHTRAILTCPPLIEQYVMFIRIFIYWFTFTHLQVHACTRTKLRFG